jgi:DNA-directed RNA polymerase subunit RPC12/RpoP
MPEERYHLDRYHKHRKWMRIQGLITGLSMMTLIGLIWAWATGIRALQHRSKAAEHMAEVDQDVGPDSVHAEGAIPCPGCEEPIEDDTVKCPHCGQKRWTKDRRQDYVVFWLPILAIVVAFFVWALLVFFNPLNHIVGIAVLVGVYWLGYRNVTNKREEDIEWLEQQEAASAPD